MKVYIGPYARYFGPFDLAELLKYVGVSEDRRFEIGERLSNTWLGKFIIKLNSNSRKVKVKIDYYDTWSMDHTLALIILPMLKQIKATKHGSAMVEDKDVPKHLRSTSAPPKKNEWDLDENVHPRWEWVLDEMIWTFEQLASDELVFYNSEKDEFDMKAYKKHQARIDNGLRLFGRYYQGLWD
jgi:hypothetical protein